MADLAKTVSIIFEGDDRVSKTITTLDSRFSAMSSSVSNFAAPFASAADAVLKIDAALAALTVGGLALAYKKSVEFESAMVGLKKVAGDSADTLEAARASAFNLSSQYGESAAKVLNSTTDFIQAGYNTQEAMTLTKAAMDLKIAGDIEAAQSSEMLIATLKGFDAPASEATRLIDILNEVSNKYATDVEQLGLGMSKLAPIAKTMGFSFEETAGILTPVIEVFRSGTESADALKTGLLKLVDDSMPVKDALASIGVSQTDANGKLKSGKEILFEVSKAFQELDQNQKLFVTSQLVGIEQSARMVTVFDNLGKVTEVTNTALNSSGSAAKEVAARLESSEVQIDRFKVGFENLGIAVGDKFRESTTKAIAGGTALLASLSEVFSSGSFDPIFNVIAGVASRIGTSLSTIAKNLPQAMEGIDFSPLINSLSSLGGAVGEAFETIFGKIDLSTPEGLHELIQKIINGFAGLIEVTHGIIDGMEPLFEILGKVVNGFSVMDSSTAQAVGTMLGAAKGISILAEYAGLLTGALTILAGKAMVDAVSGLASLASTAAKTLPGLSGMVTVIGSLSGAGAVGALGAAGALGYLTGSLLNQIPVVQKGAQSLLELLDVNDNYFGIISKNKETQDAQNKSFEAAKIQHQKLVTSLNSQPESKSTKLNLETSSWLEGANNASKALFNIPDKKETTLTAKADTVQMELVKKLVTETLPDGTVSIHEVFVNEPKLAAAKKTLDEALPKEKKIDASIETARIKAQADIISQAIEWKAKVDISQAEQATKQLESMLKSIDTGIDSTGDTLASLFKTMEDTGSNWQLYDAIEKEKEYREQEFELQKKLVEQQLKLQEAKTKALESGSQVIQVEAAGLQPHLEMILWEILSAIQVRANEEAAEFLLGVKGA